MSSFVEDLEYIEHMGLTAHQKFTAQSVINVLHYLKTLSKIQHKPIEDFTVADIVANIKTGLKEVPPHE